MNPKDVMIDYTNVYPLSALLKLKKKKIDIFAMIAGFVIWGMWLYAYAFTHT